MFKKILIANRGEIAVRVIRACREMGISAVAVFSEADRGALHVRMADEAYPIGAAPSRESYLVVEKILDAARLSGVDAIHPGYGFLAENDAFAQACEDTGVTFIGPSAHSMRLMGSKVEARRAAAAYGVEMVPGTMDPIESEEEARHIAHEIGFPIMLKASGGGGGKGLRLIRSGDELSSALRDTRSEALAAFGDDAVYIEKYLEQPRHVEIQILADRHGSAVYLGERECSLQRRHQKVLEESPSPIVDADMRRRMGEAALKVVRASKYHNAGTVEFLVDRQRKFYFLEMNTRLQVEHPVTEFVTGVDLVKQQIRVAAGETLGIRQEDVVLRGHAIECRIYAEDPDNNFFPSAGRISMLRTPAGPGIRDDNGVYEGWTVPLEYDPLISKLVAWAPDRSQAIERMKRALGEYRVEGIKTNIGFFMDVLDQAAFRNGDFDTGYIDGWLQSRTVPTLRREDRDLAILAAALFHSSRVETDRNGSGSAASRASVWKSAGRAAALRKR